MTWWSEAMDVYFNCSRIGIEHENLKKKNKTWRVEGFTFRLADSDVKKHNYEIEEALWASTRGLS